MRLRGRTSVRVYCVSRLLGYPATAHQGASPCSAEGGAASSSVNEADSNALSTMPLMFDAAPPGRLPSSSAFASTAMARAAV